MTNNPVGDCLAAGFQALLRGDTAERDRQVDRAEAIMRAQAAIPKIDLGSSEIVARLLRLAEHEAGRPLTAAERALIERHPAAVLKQLLASGYRMPANMATVVS